MAYWEGRVSGCWWAYFTGVIDDSEWEQFCAHQRRAYTTGAPGDVILTIPYRTEPPTAKQRKPIGDLIVETRVGNRVTHHAFATDSRVIFMINTAINWIASKPYQESTFADPVAAVRWLAEVAPRVDATAVIASMASSVPESKLWPPLAAASARRRSA